MIETITLSKTATFGDQSEVLGPLRRVNFIFGTNGTGKTTISRVIADGTGYASCGVVWKDGRPIQALVYNRDFVERNFSRSAELKGVFTLGEKQVKAQEEINAKKVEADGYKEKVRLNAQQLIKKSKEPSQIFELEAVGNITAAIEGLIADANKKVAEHNALVKNIGKEKAKLISEVWKHLIEVDLGAVYADYKAKKAELEGTIRSIEGSFAPHWHAAVYRASLARGLHPWHSVWPSVWNR